MKVLIRLDLNYFYMIEDDEYYLLSKYPPKNWRISSLTKRTLDTLSFVAIPEWV